MDVTTISKNQWEILALACFPDTRRNVILEKILELPENEFDEIEGLGEVLSSLRKSKHEV